MMKRLLNSDFRFSNAFIVFMTCFTICSFILVLVESLGKLEPAKLQAIQPIALVLIGILPSIATVIFSELIKFKTSIQLKEIERKQDMLTKRESLYKSLLENIEGFFIPEDEIKKAKFFSEYRVAWLYANDEVMRAINNFFNSINREHSTPSQKSGEFYQMIISAMRNDIVTLKPLDDTTLKSEEVNQTGSSKR